MVSVIKDNKNGLISLAHDDEGEKTVSRYRRKRSKRRRPLVVLQKEAVAATTTRRK